MLEDGVESISIISRADAYGRGLAEATASAFEAGGGVIKNIVYHAPDATEFNSEVTAVGKVHLMQLSVFFPCYWLWSSSTLHLSKAFLDTPWYMTDGVKDAGLASLCNLGTALDGMKGTAPGSAAGEAFDAFSAAYAEVSADGAGTFISLLKHMMLSC